MDGLSVPREKRGGSYLITRCLTGGEPVTYNLHVYVAIGLKWGYGGGRPANDVEPPRQDEVMRAFALAAVKKEP